MKYFFILLFACSQSHAQIITAKQAKKLSGEIAGCIKKHSIFFDSLNLKNITADLEEHIDTFTTYKKVGDYYTRQLHKVGDKHSFYTSKMVIDSFSAKQKETIAFSYQLMDGNIGYLNIPGFLSSDNAVVNAFANQIHNAIRELDTKQEIKGWIIDLRNNDGGNMWPMVLGLHPLIGNETPGYFNDRNNNSTAWKTASPYYGIAITAAYELKNDNNKIAVLYSKKTASSGEMTAVCFIGKPNCRSFGTVTGGYTTGNRVFELSDNNIYVLACTYVLDRNKKMYTGTIAPDVLFDNAKDAAVVEQAKAWVKGN